jgi:hypothetical protein
LGVAIGKALKDVDRLIDLPEEIVRGEVPVAVFARLEDNPGLPGGCKNG